jgi:cytochrome c6
MGVYKMILVVLILTVSVCLFATAPFAKDRPKGKSGAELFSHFCVECHPDGGNLLDPKKTLRKADREANNIMTAEDIINKIWNVGPFAMHPESRLTMKRFNPATIPYEDALAIANYIKETFK